eukprot:29095_1
MASVLPQLKSGPTSASMRWTKARLSRSSWTCHSKMQFICGPCTWIKRKKRLTRGSMLAVGKMCLTRVLGFEERSRGGGGSVEPQGRSWHVTPKTTLRPERHISSVFSFRHKRHESIGLGFSTSLNVYMCFGTTV